MFGKPARLEFRTYNYLKNLPKEIGSLVRLRSLYLNNNKLTSLPKEIELLGNLLELHINNNQSEGISQNLLCGIKLPTTTVIIK